MKEYIRWAKKIVEKSIKTRRIIIISGARQVGKTTLTQQSVTQNATFRTLDDTNLLATALDDPSGFLKHSAHTLIIDEIQKAPLLLPEIKKIVDNNNDKGQFVLTGSADIRSRPEVNESLAGRVKNIRLRALTEGEIRGNTPIFLQRAFNFDFPDQVDCSKDLILDIAFRGGYPEVINLSKEEQNDWHKDYIHTLLTRDLRNIANIRRENALKELLRNLSAWSGKYMDIDGICSACQLSKPTMKEYIALIEDLYLCERVPAWIRSDYDRIAKRSKIYITDTGLMSSILNWHYSDIALDADRYGKLIETFIFNELKTQTDLAYDYSLYHYRDRENREIDFIIENADGDILGIEVKGGSRVGKDDFKHLSWFGNTMAKNKKFLGIVLYSGENTLYFGENMAAVPSACLWEE
ncbi:MAG: ATP-binding protein [Alphaproteobacteria bacterium]|nr:ATP-binding protein [Alphaproteobacteria bacterium]